MDMADLVAERHTVEAAQLGQSDPAPLAQAWHQSLAESSRVFAGRAIPFELLAAQVSVKAGIIEQAPVQPFHQFGVTLLVGELHGADKLVHLRL